jgi:hypothetical protein
VIWRNILIYLHDILILNFSVYIDGKNINKYLMISVLIMTYGHQVYVYIMISQ